MKTALALVSLVVIVLVAIGGSVALILLPLVERRALRRRAEPRAYGEIVYREGKDEYLGNRLILFQLPEATYAVLQYADGIVHEATTAVATILGSNIEFEQEVGDVTYRFSGTITDDEVIGTQTGSNGFSLSLRLCRIPFGNAPVPPWMASAAQPTSGNTRHASIVAAEQTETARITKSDLRMWKLYSNGARVILPTTAEFPGGFPQEVSPAVGADLSVGGELQAALERLLVAQPIVVRAQTQETVVFDLSGEADHRAFHATWDMWHLLRSKNAYTLSRGRTTGTGWSFGGPGHDLVATEPASLAAEIAAVFRTTYDVSQQQ